MFKKKEHEELRSLHCLVAQKKGQVHLKESRNQPSRIFLEFGTHGDLLYSDADEEC
jgi:hypothetical protein